MADREIENDLIQSERPSNGITGMTVDQIANELATSVIRHSFVKNPDGSLSASHVQSSNGGSIIPTPPPPPPLKTNRTNRTNQKSQGGGRGTFEQSQSSSPYGQYSQTGRGGRGARGSRGGRNTRGGRVTNIRNAMERNIKGPVDSDIDRNVDPQTARLLKSQFDSDIDRDINRQINNGLQNQGNTRGRGRGSKVNFRDRFVGFGQGQGPYTDGFIQSNTRGRGEARGGGRGQGRGRGRGKRNNRFNNNNNNGLNNTGGNTGQNYNYALSLYDPRFEKDPSMRNPQWRNINNNIDMSQMTTRFNGLTSDMRLARLKTMGQFLTFNRLRQNKLSAKLIVLQNNFEYEVNKTTRRNMTRKMNRIEIEVNNLAQRISDLKEAIKIIRNIHKSMMTMS